MILGKKGTISQKHHAGFTIVEVMIVLAIASVIILIVFFAVPALQRNSRNTQRNNDASLVGAAVHECLGNRKGQVSSCNTTALLSPFLDESKLRQLTTVNIDTAMPDDHTSVHIAFVRKCNTDGSAATEVGASLRSVALLFNTENTANAEIPRCQEVQ